MTNPRRLIIIGASGHGKVVADLSFCLGTYDDIYFLDDDKSIKTCSGFSVIGPISDYVQHLSIAHFAVAIGKNEVRREIMQGLISRSAMLPALIHPSAIIGRDVTIEDGSVVLAGVVINPGTRIGRGCILNTSCSVDHDCVLDDFVHVSPGAHLAGNVSIGQSAWIGMGVSVIQGVVIGQDVIIGANSLVLKNITKPGTYVGSPIKS
jgi:sugar O-acyltransferase (sialic acid O-acetyltransferase NeuD family)